MKHPRPSPKLTRMESTHVPIRQSPPPHPSASASRMSFCWCFRGNAGAYFPSIIVGPCTRTGGDVIVAVAVAGTTQTLKGGIQRDDAVAVLVVAVAGTTHTLKGGIQRDDAVAVLVVAVAVAGTTDTLKGEIQREAQCFAQPHPHVTSARGSLSS
eukprot:364531-Chlamydomonas_euryale.AAC.5